MKVNGPRGTKDILPEEIYKWQYIEKKFRDICENFGYGEIRTPVFEHTELFERGVGETTDVVQKEMYTFKDKGDRSITLKPEGTASVVRSYIENKTYSKENLSKLYYITPCFRYERPQAGRLREFHQLGLEALGSQNPSVDTEIISLIYNFFKEIGLKDIQLRINSIGCPKCRGKYNELVREFLEKKLDKLCETCNERFYKNPLRIIDCKNDNCQKEIVGIPKMIDNLCEECSDHFEELKLNLDNLNIEYIVDPNIVRGLDYYTKTAFEFISEEIGAKSTVCGGGRYDNLVESLGGVETPAVGFAMGIERLLLAIENGNIDIEKKEPIEVYIVAIGKEASKIGDKILNNLRIKGIKGDRCYQDKGLKYQMKQGNKVNAKNVIIIGEEEVKENKVLLKNMETGLQEEVSIAEITSKF